jgi:hypothetical protein
MVDGNDKKTKNSISVSFSRRSNNWQICPYMVKFWRELRVVICSGVRHCRQLADCRRYSQKERMSVEHLTMSRKTE